MHIHEQNSEKQNQHESHVSKVEPEEYETMLSDDIVAGLVSILNASENETADHSETSEDAAEMKRSIMANRVSLRSVEGQAAAEQLVESKLTSEKSGNNLESSHEQSRSGDVSEAPVLLCPEDNAGSGNRSSIRHLDDVLAIRSRSRGHMA